MTKTKTSKDIFCNKTSKMTKVEQNNPIQSNTKQNSAKQGINNNGDLLWRQKFDKKECRMYVYKELCGLSLLRKGSVKPSILYSIDVAMSLYIVIIVYKFVLFPL